MKPDDLVALADAAGVRLWIEEGALRFRTTKGSLPSGLRAQLAEHREQVIHWLLADGLDCRTEPLSLNQTRLFLIDQIDRRQTTYNMAVAFRSRSKLPIDKLEQAARSVVRRHESLRSRVRTESGEPRQAILAREAGAGSVSIEQIRAPGVEIQDWLADEASRRFDLANSPPLRISVLERPDVTVVLFAFHHLFFDGGSYKVFFNEINAVLRDEEHTLARVELQYADYVRVERERLSARREEILSYWTAYLSEAPTLTTLPTDHPRVAPPDHCGATLVRRLASSDVARLESLAGGMGSSLFVVMGTLFAAFLSRWIGRADLVLGVPFDGRDLPGANGAIGFYSTLLPLRLRLDGNSTLAEATSQTARSVADAFAHLHMPIEQVMRTSGLSGRADTNPLMQTVFTLEQDDARALVVDGEPLDRIIVSRNNVNVELEVSARHSGGALDLTWTYAASLFECATIQAAADAFQYLLTAREVAGEMRLSALPRPSTPAVPLGAPPSGDALLLRAIGRRAEAAPDRQIFQSGDGLTMAQLAVGSGRVAQALHDRGLAFGAALTIRSSAATPITVATVVGAWRAGAFVRMATPRPGEHAGTVELNLGHGRSGTEALDLDLPHLVFGGEAATDVREAIEALQRDAALVGEDAEALLFQEVSGGAALTHGSLAAVIGAVASVAEVGEQETIAATAAPWEEASLLQMWLALGTGASLDLPALATGAGALVERLASCRRADVFHVPGRAVGDAVEAGWRPPVGSTLIFERSLPATGVLDRLVSICPEHVALLVTGRSGRMPFVLWAAATGQSERNGLRLAPLPGTNCQLLDIAGGDPAPAGAVGEIAAAATGDAEDWCRTGIVAKRADDGFFHPCDTEDALLIDPPDEEEVRAAIAACPEVRSSEVSLRTSQGRRQLIASVNGYRIDHAHLDRHLAVRLRPHWRPILQSPSMRGVVASSSPTESLVLAAWEQVLGGAPEGVHSNFFSVGGHSLLAIRLANALSSQTGTAITPLQIFEHPTVASLAGLVAAASASTQDRAGSDASKIPRLAGDAAPLSTHQRRLWAADQIGFSGAGQAVPLRYEITGRIADREALAAAFIDLVTRHSSLRTTFQGGTEAPRQLVQPPPANVLQTFDLRGLDMEQAGLRGEVFERSILDARFELACGPVFRAGLVTYADERHVLCINAHHIVTDGWSTANMIGDLRVFYESRLAGVQAGLPALEVQYKDYAAWQAEEIGRRATQGSLYWQKRLKGAPKDHGLEVFPRPRMPSHAGAILSMQLDEASAVALEALAASVGATIFAAVSTALACAVGKLSARQHVTLGTPTTSRHRTELEPLVGLFVETMPMLFRIVPGEALDAALARCAPEIARDRAHHDVSFGTILRAAGVRQEFARHPLFQILVTEADACLDEFQLGEARATHTRSSAGEARFDLTLSFARRTGQGIALSWTYASEILDEDRVRQIASAFQGMLENPASPDEQNAVPGPGSGRLPGATSCLLAMFDEHAMANPHAPACRWQEASLSYRDLWSSSWNVGRTLAALGVRSEDRVGLLFDRTGAALVGMLGSLRAGAAYVPLEPQHPTGRLRTILVDSGAPVLLADEASLRRHGWSGQNTSVLDASMALPDGCTCLLIDADGTLRYLHPAIEASPVPALLPRSDAEGMAAGATLVGAGNASGSPLAYVLYTSGTTGTPRGVLVEQNGVRGYLEAQSRFLDMGGEAKTRGFLCLTSFAFDTCVSSLWGALGNGRCVNLASEDERYDPDFVADALCRPDRYAAVYVPPALLAELSLPEGLELVPRIIVSGEPAAADLVSRLAGRTGLYNEYGPTEATVCATVHRFGISDNPGRIGAPIDGVTVSVRGTDGRNSGPGEEGELWIGGAGVARGYLNSPELTAERFVTGPDGERRYRTGDWVRRLPGGDLLFLGRRDGQVKLRGQRLELSEIKVHLENVEGVAGALVRVRRATDGREQLAAYLLLSHSHGDQGPAVVLAACEALKANLPSYMAVALWSVLARWPLTTNGKIDESFLPEPTPLRGLAAPTMPRSVANGDTLAQTLADLWEQLLGSRPGPDSHFFDFGGDSIAALQLVARASEKGIRLMVRDVMGLGTLEAMAAKAQQEGRPSAAGDDPRRAAADERLPLLPMQREFLVGAKAAQRDHFNQAMLLTPSRKLTAPELREAAAKLIMRQEALRLRFHEDSDGWYARVADDVEDEAVSAVVRLPLPSMDCDTIEAACDAQQRSLSVRFGPVFRIALLDHADGQRLLLVFHHLVVDAVSWPLILAELGAALSAPVAEPARYSFSRYAEAVRFFSGLAGSAAVQAQVPFWRAGLARLKPSTSTGESQAAIAPRAGRLDAATTQCLLGRARRGSSGLDMVLAALAIAGRRCGLAADTGVPISLETHGRTIFDPDVDVSTTVGWFSSTYPVIVELPSAAADVVDDAVAAARWALDAVPAGGAHYQVIRNAGLLGENAAEPALLLNYFGGFSAVDGTASGALFQKARERLGEVHGSNPMHPRDATVLCGLGDGQMVFTVVPGAGRITEEQAGRLCDEFEQALQRVAGAAIAGQDGQGASAWSSVIGAEVSDAWPATGMQQGLLFEEQVHPGIYLTELQLTFENAVGQNLRRAFAALVERHESLRSCFQLDASGVLHQVVLKQVDLPWLSTDLRGMAPAQRTARMAAARDQNAARSLDVSRAPLHRVHELLTGPGERVVLWSVHHSCTDGWSLPIMIRELRELHDAFAAERQPELPPAPSFGSFARWVREQDPEHSLGHWRSRLLGVQEATPLPVRHPLSKSLGHGKIEHEWDAAGSLGLTEAARRYRCTAATLLRAAWGGLLARYAGQQDVVFGAVVSGRPPELPSMQSAVGLFISTIPARVRIDPLQPIEAWLQDLQQESVDDSGHSFLPLREIEALVPSLQGRLFRSILAFENYPVERNSTGPGADGLRLQAAMADEQTNFELTLQAQLSGCLRLRLSYATATVGEELAGRLMRDLDALLAALCRSTATCVGQLPIRPSLAETLPGSEIAGGAAQSLGVARRFAAIAQATPEAIAIEHRERRVSYAELDRHASWIASKLIASGVQAGQRVGIRALRGIGAVTAMLAVLKIGAAYVPIDPRFPEARARRMLQLADAQLLIIMQPVLQGEFEGIEQMELDEPAGAPAQTPPARNDPDAVAYVMFTSGSTGEPKGVVVTHRAIERLVIDPGYVLLTQRSRIAHASNLAFDASTFEVWGAVLNGGCLVVLDEETMQDMGHLMAALREARIDTMFLTTALFDQIVAIRPEAFASLEQLLFGGEAVAPRTVETLLSSDPPRRLIHVYGPTENTTFSTAYEIRAVAPSYPIGRFIKGTSGAILSAAGLPLPAGQVGELYLCGAGLALGYAGRPDLTRERFAGLVGAAASETFYRTGDLVWVSDTGDLTFIGRTDKQVKVRGFRVEPEEVRLHLLESAEVADAHLLVVGEAGDSRLAAAVVLSEAAQQHAGDFAQTQHELDAHLRKELPSYMLPSQWLLVESLPLTANAKVDEHELRRRMSEKSAGIVNAHIPRNGVEMALYNIWSEILRAKNISVNDDFFSVGGTSISAIKLRHRMQQIFGVDVPLSEFLKSPTIASVAARVRDGRGATPAEPQRTVEFKEGAGDTDIVCVHPAGGTAFTYLPLARAVPDAHRVVGIQAFGVERDEPLPMSVEAMAESYLARLDGDDRPRIFVGASFGGLVAYEMARQLAEQGKPAVAVMLDSQATDDPRLLASIVPVTLEVFRAKLVKYSGMYPGISDEEIDRYFRLYNHHLMLLKEADLKPSSARTTLVLATGDKSPAHQAAMTDYWHRRIGNLRVEMVDGDHSTVLEPPQLSLVVNIIREEGASIRGARS